MSSAKQDFLAEAEDLLEEAGRLILEIQDTFQEGINPDTINALFRSMHTLKGLSGLFGRQGIADLSHSFESLLDDMRLGKIEINDEVVSFLFSNLDIIRTLVAETDKEQDVLGHIKNIEVFKNSAKGKSKGPDLKGIIDESLLMVLSEYEEARLRANIQEGKGVYLAKAVFPIADFDKSLENITALIKSKGELISTLPTSSNVPPDTIGFNLMFGTLQPLEQLKDKLGIEVSQLNAPKSIEPLKPVQAAQDAALKSSTSVVRVDIEKLDRILNTIGELALANSAVKRISEELFEMYGHSHVVGDTRKVTQVFDKRLSELQGQVLEIRMIPIGQIFSRLAQVIRRYSREIGKKIELLMYGEDTEIDKYIAEEIVDPLMHLVRNSIDHGIEPVEERIKKGKKDTGTIILKAFQKGNHVVIEVKDDGTGINMQKVKRKAIEMGMIDSAEDYDEKALVSFIFAPGFSTKEVVSEVSGRGVGMDVVKNKLASVGGFAEVFTEEGKGTVVSLTIPITLAIVKSLLVRVKETKFAIPLTSISETIAVSRDELQTVEGREVYNLRGEMLPIINIGKLFGIEEVVADRFFVVVVGAGKRKHGLVVDELFGQHEIVIKSLGKYFAGHRGFAGAAETGRYEVALVIDVDAIIEESAAKKAKVA